MTFQAASVPTSAASAGSASATLDSLAAVILCTAIVVGPLALGGTPAWACLGLEAAMATSAVLWAVARPRPVALLVIPLAIAALVLAQLVPLPDSVLTTIAPVSAGAWKVVHQGMPDAWGRISITPAASAAAARRLLLGITTILVVADVAHEPRRRRWLFTALAAVGGLVWLLAAVLPDDPKKPAVYGIYSLRGPIISWKTHERPPMQTTGVGEFDWVTVGEQRYRADGAIPGTAVGPYIYANHFANALCLTMPALCAIWLVYTRRRLPRPIALLGVVVVMGAALWGGFAWAASRAGTASLLFGCVVYLGLIVEARWLQWLLGGAATAGVLAIMGYMAVFQGPLARLVALGPAAWQPAVTAALQDGRMVAARIAGRMFLASPVLGTGLGSYGDLFPRFTGREWIFYFAHNDHAQLWAEAGLVGVVAWGLAAAVLVRRFARFWRERRPVARSVDAAAWAALAAGAAHSVFDWNMHAPANALLACVVVGLAISSVVPRAGLRPGWTRGSGLITAGFVIAVVWATALLARDALLDRRLEDLRRTLTAARLATSPAEHARAVERLTAAIAKGEAARGWAGRDWQLPVHLGQARLHLEHAAAVGAVAGAVHPSGGRPAGDWFREGMLASPACRGLPEPVPPR
jgi:O-antigen ligase